MAHLKQKQIGDNSCKAIIIDTLLEAVHPLTREELSGEIAAPFSCSCIHRKTQPTNRHSIPGRDHPFWYRRTYRNYASSQIRFYHQSVTRNQPAPTGNSVMDWLYQGNTRSFQWIRCLSVASTPYFSPKLICKAWRFKLWTSNFYRRWRFFWHKANCL